MRYDILNMLPLLLIPSWALAIDHISRCQTPCIRICSNMLSQSMPPFHGTTSPTSCVIVSTSSPWHARSISQQQCFSLIPMWARSAPISRSSLPTWSGSGSRVVTPRARQGRSARFSICCSKPSQVSATSCTLILPSQIGCLHH